MYPLCVASPGNESCILEGKGGGGGGGGGSSLAEPHTKDNVEIYPQEEVVAACHPCIPV